MGLGVGLDGAGEGRGVNGRRRVGVIATVFDEATTIKELVESLLHQTRPPDEIVISDAGSTDGTWGFLTQLSETEPGLVVIRAPGNRSAGRNAAIRATTSDIVCCIDAGCVAEPDWVERLIEPFAGGAEFVGGFYRPQGATALATCIGLVMVYVRQEAESVGFLPSARSVAFTREAFERVGGFPEQVEYAEDTLFMQRLLDTGFECVPALDAVVAWNPPTGLGALARTSFRWGRGDGEARLRGYTFKRLAVIYGLIPVLGLMGTILTGWAVVAAAGVVALDTARRTRFKYRWAPTSGLALIPLCHLVATYSSLTGFLVGRYRPRRP